MKNHSTSNLKFKCINMIAGFITMAFIFPVVVFSGYAANPQWHHHESRLIIKFTEQSDLYHQLNALEKKSVEPTLYPLIAANDPAFFNSSEEFMDQIYGFFISQPIQRMLPLISSINQKNNTSGLERIFMVYLADGTDLLKTLENIQERDDVEYAEPDFVGNGGGKPSFSSEFEIITNIPKMNPPVNDPHFIDQYGLLNTGQIIGGVAGIAGADINIVPGWEITTGDSNIVLGVLDSGIPSDHPEFAGRVTGGYNFVSDNNNYLDDHGHGSSVSSIAAATGNNSDLMAGTDWHCSIIPVKILDNNNSGYYSWWINGITYAVDNGAHVLNMSVGGSSYSSGLHDAVNYALENGVIVVACMMNDNNDVTYYPAGFEHVIAIGATNNTDLRAEPFAWGGGSNYGNHIDFAAPGDRIASLSGSGFQFIGFWSGTSMSTPFVAATISLMLSINPELTRDEIYEILRETTRDQIIGKTNKESWDQFTGWGRIDVGAALELTQQGTVPSSIDPNSIAASNKPGLVYPNPASGQINIVASAAIHTLEIRNISGKQIATYNIQHTTSSLPAIDISHLSNGVYLLRYVGKEQIYTEKFIVKNP